MSDREAMQMALEALNLPSMKTQQMLQQRDEAIATLRAQLEQPEQEQHQPWCNSVTKLLLSNPPQIPPCNCKQEPVTQSEQEPVALIRDGVLRWHIPHEYYSRPAWTAHGTHMLYASPPQRKPLTIKEINALPEAKGYWPMGMNDRIVRLIRAIEAAHGIGEKP